MQILHNNTGICLTEILVAMAAGMVILSTTFQALTFFESKLVAQQGTISRHQDQRLGLHVIEEELRLAGTGSTTELTGHCVIRRPGGRILRQSGEPYDECH
jgi:Tfp pilus assembly protein PilW